MKTYSFITGLPSKSMIPSLYNFLSISESSILLSSSWFFSSISSFSSSIFCFNLGICPKSSCSCALSRSLKSLFFLLRFFLNKKLLRPLLTKLEHYMSKHTWNHLRVSKNFSNFGFNTNMQILSFNNFCFSFA